MPLLMFKCTAVDADMLTARKRAADAICCHSVRSEARATSVTNQ